MTSTSKQRKFEELYRLHRDSMLRLSRSIIHSPELAEEAVQEAFIKILNHLHKLDDVNSARTAAYLRTVVQNVTLKIYNRKQSESNVLKIEDLGPLWEKNVDEPFNRLTWDVCKIYEIRETIEEVRQKLNQRERELLMLRYQYGWKLNTLSSVFGCSPKSVSVKLSRLKKRFVKLKENASWMMC